MYCRNCGKKLPDNARFCIACGTEVSTASEQEKPHTESPLTDAQVSPAAEPQAAPTEQSTPAEMSPAVVESAEASEGKREEAVPTSDDMTVHCDEESAASDGTSADTMQYDPAAGAVVGGEAAPLPAQPKKKGKKIAVICIAAAAVLALAVGLFAFFTVYNSPANRLTRAAKNTVREFGGLFEDCDRFRQTCTALDETVRSEKISARFDYSDNDGAAISIDFGEDLNAKEISASLNMNTNGQNVNLQAYIDDDTAYIGSRQLLGSDVYSLELDRLGQKLLDSPLAQLLGDEDDIGALAYLDIDLFADRSLTVYFKEYPEEYRALMKALTIEKIGKESDGEVLYRITADRHVLGEVFAAYLEFSTDLRFGEGYYEAAVAEAQDAGEQLGGRIAEIPDFLSEMDIELTVGVRSGLISYIEFFAEGEDFDDVRVSITVERRHSKEEDSMTFDLVTDEENVTLRVEKTAAGALLTVGDGADDLCVELFDSEGCFRAYRPDGSETQEVRFGLEGKKVWVSASADDADLEISVAPCRMQRLDTADAISLLDMTPQELQMLLYSFLVGCR